MNNKKTNKEMFEILATVIENETIENELKKDLTEFIKTRIELIDKKSTTISKKDIEKMEKNDFIKETIIDFLTKNDKGFTVTEIITNCEPLNNFTTQKITPILSKLVVENIVERTIEKRKSYYAINE